MSIPLGIMGIMCRGWVIAELQHSQGLPTHFAHGCPRLVSADELPCMASTVGIGVHRSGNAEGVGLGNRFAQEVDQSVADARVLDASGSEKKPHGAFSWLSRRPAR